MSRPCPLSLVSDYVFSYTSPPPLSRTTLDVTSSWSPPLQNYAQDLPYIPWPYVHSILLLRRPLQICSLLIFPATISGSNTSLSARPSDFFPTDWRLMLVWLPLTAFPMSQLLIPFPTWPVQMLVLKSGVLGGGILVGYKDSLSNLGFPIDIL